eukprot:gnl/MRDRNA2_/MRDRNA2_187867_c0_seq1.p1 gnl/MRDRNA2_/MRDRNA2_187867_c0~~gnl/MRDRNA2_/MRDRNA2_187867_c0_seq1.p1  ORF type:complete len:309 (-),score=41.66 gnl/MRDRNA2_/MRDRNA2_187867_c0_seq1:395-1252(-)
MIPEIMHGLIGPVGTLVYEKMGFYTLTFIWLSQRCSQKMNKNIFPVICAMIVESAEALRLVSLLSAVLAKSPKQMLQEALINALGTTVADIQFRGQIVMAIAYRLVGKAYVIPTEMDTFLRARVVFGYMPFFPLFATVLPAVYVGQVQWASKWEFWALVVFGFVIEVLVDVIFIQLQRQQGETFWKTFKRLQQPHTHEAFGAKYRSVLPKDEEDGQTFQHTATNESRQSASSFESQSHGLTICGPSINELIMSNLLLAYMVWIMISISIQSTFGKCGFIVSEQFC